MRTKSEIAHSKKRTNVLLVAAKRWGAVALEKVSPQLAARWAERIYLTPPRLALRNGEAEFLKTGHRFERKTPRGRRFTALSWGDGPTIFLVHGWGGHAGQFRSFVPALVQAGYSVIALEAPAHGGS